MADKLVKQIVDAIADKEYAKLIATAQIDVSWVEPEQTQEEAILAFGEWLDEQLAMWEEDEEKTFAIEHFNESCLEIIELEECKLLATYHPTSLGEKLDLWFEIIFEMEDSGQIFATFNVNI